MVPGEGVGDEKPTLVDAERDTGGSEVSNKIGDASGMVFDPDGESILNSEKGGLKANGVQEGSEEGVSLFAPLGDKFPLAE